MLPGFQKSEPGLRFSTINERRVICMEGDKLARKEELWTGKCVSRRSFLKAGAVGSLSIFGTSGWKLPSAFGAEDERFLIADPSEMNTLDPMASVDVGRAFYRLNFYDSLTRWRDVPPEIQPWLAESWE